MNTAAMKAITACQGFLEGDNFKVLRMGNR